MIVYVGLGPGFPRMHYQFFVLSSKLLLVPMTLFLSFRLCLSLSREYSKNDSPRPKLLLAPSKMTKRLGCCNERNVEAKALSVVLGITWLPFLAGVRASSRPWHGTPLCQFLRLPQPLRPFHAVEQSCLR
jgi:hypothetical protein